MNSSLQRLIALSEGTEPIPGRGVIGFEIYHPDEDDPVLTGRYRPNNSKDRAVFSQSVGKLLMAGYEVVTWRLDREPGR